MKGSWAITRVKQIRTLAKTMRIPDISANTKIPKREIAQILGVSESQEHTAKGRKVNEAEISGEEDKNTTTT